MSLQSGGCYEVEITTVLENFNAKIGQGTDGDVSGQYGLGIRYNNPAEFNIQGVTKNLWAYSI